MGVTSAPFTLKLPVIVISPATVPVCTAARPTGKFAVVDPAGTVNGMRRMPLENSTAGSSAPLSGRNVSTTAPSRSVGNGAAVVIPNVIWLLGADAAADRL